MKQSSGVNYWSDDRLSIERLKQEYKLHHTLVIGFDFDNTIYDSHDNGLNVDPVKLLLKQCSVLGFTMCLYTISSNPDEMTTLDKIDYCTGIGIQVDYVNKSPLLPNPYKPFFNILLDDRAGLAAAYNTLRTALLELNLIL